MTAAILRMLGYRESDVEIENGIENGIDIAGKMMGVLWALRFAQERRMEKDVRMVPWNA